jgi:hypothetical protein
MSDLEAQSLESGETQTFDNGTSQKVTVSGSTWVRTTFQPGWRWSESLKAMAKTDSCQVHHVGYAVSGHLHVRTNEGDEQDIQAGEAYNIPPGHDGWVVGGQPYVAVELRID